MKSSSKKTAIHPDLVVAQKFAYEPHGLTYKNFIQEAESQEYGACTFEINNRFVIFRAAKITPTKIGQFVTLWKRCKTGIIVPYDMADRVDLFVISVRNVEKLGQFVFPKAVLHEKGFVSKEGKNGKLAMRVYPSWDAPDNRQAQKTQEWQLCHFFEINQQECDIFRINKLFFD